MIVIYVSLQLFNSINGKPPTKSMFYSFPIKTYPALNLAAKGTHTKDHTHFDDFESLVCLIR